MALPTYVNAGSIATAAAAIATVPPSSLAVDDVCYLLVESLGTDPAPTLSGGSGFGAWTKIVDQVQGGTRMTVFRAVVTATSPTGPTVSDTGDHQATRMIGVRGADTAAPNETPTTGVDATSDTSGNLPGHTTVGPDRLVLLAAVADLPDATGTAEYSWTSFGNLASGAERTDNSVTSGNGGSLSWATGTLATAGAIGSVTYTKANAGVKVHAVIPVKPPGVAASGSSSARGGGAVAGAGAKQGLASSSSRSGGQATSSVRKGALAASSARGGGSVVSAGFATIAGVTGTSSARGGGSATSSGAKAASGSSSVRGGGQAAAAARKSSTGTSSVRGGGTGVAAGREGAFTPTGVSGGGGVTSAGRKSVAGTSSTRGGGTITSSGSSLEAHTGSSSVRGGGRPAGTGTSSRSATSSARGGGRPTSTSSTARSSTSSARGGGAIVTSTRGAHLGASSVRGGGFVTSTTSSSQAAGPPMTSRTIAGGVRGATSSTPASGIGAAAPKAGRTRASTPTGRSSTLLEEG